MSSFPAEHLSTVFFSGFSLCVVQVTTGYTMAAVTSEQYLIERLAVTYNNPVSHLQLTCCPSHCAVPWQGKNIRIYENNNLEVFVHLYLFSMNVKIKLNIFEKSPRKISRL